MLTQIIDGKWKVVKKLGSGAMGRVVLAQKGDEELVAIKLLNKSLASDKTDAVIQRFKSEFAILKELSHPGINKVYDFGFDKELGQYFFTTEYVSGVDFLNAVKDATPDQIEALFIDILRALEYLHSHGIIHCDIKSGNVLVEERDDGSLRVRLIDFGLAALSTPDRIIGTPAYMAPEVILRNRPDNRADLYSLGVLIYAALTQYNPFRAGDMTEMFERHLNVRPEPPSKYNSEVKPYLDDILLKLLKKSPSERFPTAAQVIRAINFSGKRSYPVETKETFLGYLPAEGNLVGRKEEMTGVREQCLSVKMGKKDVPFILCVEGDIGTGKKRLLTELKYFAQLNEMEVVSIRSTDKGSLAEFEAGIDRLMADFDRPTVVSCSVLGLLAVDISAAKIVNMMRMLIRRLKAGRAASNIRALPKIMFAFAARPGEREVLMHLLDLEEGQQINLVKLENFNERETGKYLTALTGEEEIPSQLVKELFKRTEGNPLFLTEVMKTLVEQGVLFDKVGRWNREAMEDIGVRFEGLKVPGSITGVLDGIYERALPGERKILEALSSWHRPATLNEINSVTKTDNLGGALYSLLKSGTVTFDPRTAVYYFSNALLREVVYEKMPRAVRSALHEVITEHLVRVQPEAFAEINWHRGKSDNLKTALDALLELGEYYLNRSQAFDAISTLKEALARLENDDYRLDHVLLHLGEALVFARRYEEAIDTYKRLLFRQDKGDASTSEDIGLTCQKLGLVYLRNGELAEARVFLDRAGEHPLKTRCDETMNIKRLNLLARCAFLEGDLDEAVTIYKRTKEEWKGLNEEDKAKVLNNDLAHVYLKQGEIDLAEKELNSDIEFFKKAGAESELERSYYSLAELNQERGDIDEAVRYFEASIEIAKRISDPEILLRAYNGLGNVFRCKGHEEKSLYWYERGLDLAIRTGEESTAAAIAVNIGLIKAGEGDLDQALDHFNCAINIFEQAEKKTPLDHGYILRANMEIADIYRTKKEFGKADRYLAEAMKIISFYPAMEDQRFWIDKVRLELAMDRGEWKTVKKLLKGLEAAADAEAKKAAYDKLALGFGMVADEITIEGEVEGPGAEAVSILDVSWKKGEGGDVNQKNYRYILEINKYLSGETDVGFVLKTILKYALELSGAEAGLTLLMDDKGTLKIEASCNIEVDKTLSEISVHIAKRAIEKDEVVVTADAILDERFKTNESVMLLGLKSVMSVPIHIKKRASGVLYLENRTRAEAFAGADKEILSAFADQAGIAIENARMLAERDEAGKKMRQELSESSVQLEKLGAQVEKQASDLKRRYRFDRLVSESARMEEVFSILARIAGTELSVCIVGESGTGKELVARAVHYNSPRAKGPFVPVNCGAIPATLIESEFFGYKAGAFTGATRDKMGLFEASGGGTIFLDEIAELDISLQSKLLRVIEEREFTRLGDTRSIKCDIRVVCATNRDLEKMVNEGKFRKDLYYRVAEIKVELPPLRERVEDIPLLIEEFVDDYCTQHKTKKRPEVDRSFIYACISYDWPGNVRELENAVRVATALMGAGKITASALPENHVLRRFAREGGRAKEQVKEAVKGGKEVPLIDNSNRYDPAKTWKEYEASIIASAYRACRFDAKETGKKLGIALTTVYKKVSELGLKESENPLFSTSFNYVTGTSLDDYVVRIFKAAWEHAGKHPYQAIKALGVSQGYFYKVMKRF